MKTGTFEELIAKNGSVEHNGETLALKQQPYLDGSSDGHYELGEAHYSAAAIDRATYDEYGTGETSHMVTWAITNSATEDESEACDWETYRVKEL